MIDYANISTRVKAAVLDGIVLMVIIYSFSFALEQFGSVPNYVRIIAFIFTFFLYEHLLVSITGATVGHFFNDIVVTQENQLRKKLVFHKALLRFILKFSLGWISLLTIHSNSKKQAIHDAAAGSVVIPYKVFKNATPKI